MFSEFRRRLTYANVAATVALVLAMSGFAVAAIPGPDGVIHGCYQKTKGTLRVATKCSKSEKAIAWNQKGPQGLQGIQGIQGIQGTQGVPGTPATKLWAVVDENSAIVRSSGGVTINRTNAGLYRLTFPQNVTQCAAVVSLGATSVGNNLQPGEAAASASGGNIGTNVVSVATFNDAGTSFLDKPFDVAVFC
jgi:hypothetical protein